MEDIQSNLDRPITREDLDKLPEFEKEELVSLFIQTANVMATAIFQAGRQGLPKKELKAFLVEGGMWSSTFELTVDALISSKRAVLTKGILRHPRFVSLLPCGWVPGSEN